MSEVWTLTIAYLRQHPARLALTAVAMASAACMVVWVVSGYDALLAQYKAFSHESMGRYTLNVFASRPAGAGAMPAPGQDLTVSPETVAALRADPAVESADPMWSQRAMVGPYNPETFRRNRAPTRGEAASRPTSGPGGTNGPAGGRRGPPGGGTALIGTDAPEPPYAMLRGRWIDPAKPDALEACLALDNAQRLNLDVGGEMQAGVGEKQQRLKIVGIVNTPVLPRAGERGGPVVRGPSSGGLYVPMKLAETIHGRDAAASFVSLRLKPDADVTKFRFGWTPKLDAGDPRLQFQNSSELEEELDAGATAKNLLVQAYAATGISMLAALFIIFTTLSMGVSERSRQFALLRAIGLTRGQIAGLIGLESSVLAIVGWAGGLVAGWVLLKVVLKADPDKAAEGMVVGRWSLLLSAACAFGGTLIAAVVPAVRAMRSRPLDALAPRPAVAAGRWPAVAVVAGLLLVALNPVLAFVVPIGDRWRYGLYSTVGFAATAIGFILLAPAVVMLAERVFTPVLAAALALEPRLLKSQLTINLWRTVGTAVSLTVGLGLYVSMQVWGYTMLGPFEPGEWVPPAMVAYLPTGVPPEAAAGVAGLPPLAGRTVLPLAVDQPKLVGDITHSGERATVVRQDNVVLVGLDPDRGLGGADPLLKLDWVAGSPETVVPQLKTSRGVVVPDHFLRESGLKVGDKFKLSPPADGSKEFEYTIAGVVRLKGWHWITKLSGLRVNSGRSAALCFADHDTVAKDFDLKTTKFFWASSAGGASGVAAGPVDAEALSASARAYAKEKFDQVYEAAGGGRPSGDAGYTVRVTTPEDVRTRIRGRADGWIWSLSQLPLVTLAVASIGVLNSVLASVRARRWDMGVLRALGFTRGTLMRLVLAEALLVGVVACLLSLGFGVVAGWCGSGISQHVSFFGGLLPTLVVPWSKLALGLGGALALCLLAALWPAVRTGRAEPLELLQAGRTAF